MISNKVKNKIDPKTNYLKLVKKYHPDVNNKIDKKILNEYMVIINDVYNEIKKGKKIIKHNTRENNKKNFYIQDFCHLFSKIIMAFLIDAKSEDLELSDDKILIIEQVSSYNLEASKALLLLFSRKIKENNNFELFLKGIVAYEQIFNNLYSYTKYYSQKIQKSGQNFFQEYIDSSTKEIEIAIKTITKWLDELIETIL